MVPSMKAKTISTISLALLLLCVAGGCRTTHGVSRKPLLAGKRPLCSRRGRPVVPDPMPYGHYQTCWHPWPGQCVGHPLEAIDVEPGSAIEPGNGIEATPQRLPAVSDLEQWETLPVPPANPTPVEDVEIELPPLDASDSEPSPATGDTEAETPTEDAGTPTEDAGTESAPETEGDAATSTSRARPLQRLFERDREQGTVLRIADQPSKPSRVRDTLVQPATFLRSCPSPRRSYCGGLSDPLVVRVKPKSAAESPRSPKGRVVPLSLEVRSRGIVQVETFHRLAAAR